MRKLAKAVNRVYRGGEKGFTLIELLVVIGILAVLAGVVTLAVSNFIGKGACQSCLTDRHNVQTAVVAYMADHAGAVPGANDIDSYLLDSPGRYIWTWNPSSGVISENCIDQGITDCVPST